MGLCDSAGALTTLVSYAAKPSVSRLVSRGWPSSWRSRGIECLTEVASTVLPLVVLVLEHGGEETDQHRLRRSRRPSSADSALRVCDRGSTACTDYHHARGR